MTSTVTAQNSDLTTRRMAALVHQTRAIVSRGLPPDPTAYLVSEQLAAHLGAPDLLAPEHQAGNPDCYRQHVVHTEPDGCFSIVALVWYPGQQTAIHDHVSWCVTGVHIGRESERRYRLVPGGTEARLVAIGDVVNEQGDVCGFAPPGDIHRVWNSGESTAISIHIYGADISRLGSSIRRVYDLPSDR